MNDSTPTYTDKRPGILSASLIFLNLGLTWGCVLFIRVFWMGKPYELPYAIIAGLGLGIGLAGLYLWSSKQDFKSRTGKLSIVLALFLTCALATVFHSLVS